MLYVHTSRIFQKSKSILEDITDFFSQQMTLQHSCKFLYSEEHYGVSLTGVIL